MSGDFIQLRWEDPDTGELHEPMLRAPIAIGREAPQMPEQWGALPISRLEMPNKQVSRYHALITITNQQLCITDQSVNGTFLNGRSVQKENQPFTGKDTLRIGPYKITAAIARDGTTNTTELNLEHSHLSKQAASPSSNAMFIWIGGLVVLALMGLATWGLFGLLLERSRPQIDSESSLPAPLPITQIFS